MLFSSPQAHASSLLEQVASEAWGQLHASETKLAPLAQKNQDHEWILQQDQGPQTIGTKKEWNIWMDQLP